MDSGGQEAEVTPAISRNTLKQQAYQVLKDMIHSHRFTPGKWINIEQLAKEMGISRTPICEAFNELEQEGLVKWEKNRGVRMIHMTPGMALDLYNVREVLEVMAVRLVTRHITGREVKELEKNLKLTTTDRELRKSAGILKNRLSIS